MSSCNWYPLTNKPDLSSFFNWYASAHISGIPGTLYVDDDHYQITVPLWCKCCTHASPKFKLPGNIIYNSQAYKSPQFLSLKNTHLNISIHVILCYMNESPHPSVSVTFDEQKLQIVTF